VKKKGEDQNSEARDRLRQKIDLHDRMVSPRALGHNKFLVICDDNGKPRWVWTGSQNWTKTGLCTQANNSVLIDDPQLAAEYRSQWTLLKETADATPDDLKTSNSEPRDEKVSRTPVRLWFTPTVGQVDLEEAREIITGAKQAILFLMFNPGPKDTLLNEIIKAARAGSAGKRLYIHGVINQDPSTSANPVALFEHANSEKADFEVVLPAAIDDITSFWQRELRKLPGTFAMVHSKVVVLDPFSEHPVLLTGSHNLGPKASGINDENLLIIRDAPGLAAAYATNIMSIYNQYRWRFRRKVSPRANDGRGSRTKTHGRKATSGPGAKRCERLIFGLASERCVLGPHFSRNSDSARSATVTALSQLHARIEMRGTAGCFLPLQRVASHR
jgi:phosphatidylserine/phosphatidylglycerophosphate/cardiolipin synthase-like enzyme